MENNFLIQDFGDRKICVKGVGRLFYESGIPISFSISELNRKGIEVSFLHMIEEFWDNGWSWKTIKTKIREEIELDIDKVMRIDFNHLEKFYNCLEQPRRRNGGYEESREMFFQYIFGVSTDDVRNGLNKEPLDWCRGFFSGLNLRGE